MVNLLIGETSSVDFTGCHLGISPVENTAEKLEKSIVLTHQYGCSRTWGWDSDKTRLYGVTRGFLAAAFARWKWCYIQLNVMICIAKCLVSTHFFVVVFILSIYSCFVYLLFFFKSHSILSSLSHRRIWHETLEFQVSSPQTRLAMAFLVRVQIFIYLTGWTVMTMETYNIIFSFLTICKANFFFSTNLTMCIVLTLILYQLNWHVTVVIVSMLPSC